MSSSSAASFFFVSAPTSFSSSLASAGSSAASRWARLASWAGDVAKLCCTSATSRMRCSSCACWSSSASPSRPASWISVALDASKRSSCERSVSEDSAAAGARGEPDAYGSSSRKDRVDRIDGVGEMERRVVVRCRSGDRGAGTAGGNSCQSCDPRTGRSSRSRTAGRRTRSHARRETSVGELGGVRPRGLWVEGRLTDARGRGSWRARPLARAPVAALESLVRS